MKPIAQTASLVVVLAALGMAGAYTWKTQFSHEAKIAKLVKAVLTDPESAQFKNISLNKESGVTCGEVNAKNKMGGYIGFTKFLSLPSGQVQLDPPNPSAN